MNERRAIWLSFLVITTLGGWFLFRHWSAVPGRTNEAVLRCLLFALVMGGVHLVGYRAYRDQATDPGREGRGAEGLSVRLAPEFGPAVRLALLQQVPILIVTCLLLDGGGLFRVWCIAVLVHWLSVLVIASRRPARPTRGDLALTRYGFWFIAIIIVAMAPLVSN